MTQTTAIAVLGVPLGVGLTVAGEGQLGDLAQMLLGVASSTVGIAVGVLIIVGALRMRQLKSYGFAMAAAILAMVPCVSPCCLLGLPAGIWALVVLMRDDVQGAFED